MRRSSTCFILDGRRLAMVMVLMIVGCSSESEPLVALDIHLFQDLNINTRDQILQRLDWLQLIADSPEGLYLPGEEWEGSSARVADADGDPADLEFIGRVELPDNDLPTIRLEKGGLPDVALDLRMLGWGEDATRSTPVAEGRLRGIRFEEGLSSIEMPFNTRPDMLPPRVTEVVPADGTTLEAECSVPVIVVVFSKPIAPTSLSLEAFTLEPIGRVMTARQDASGLVVQINLEELVGSGSITYSLSISTALEDLDGRALDQIPTEDGAQPFEASFTYSCPAIEHALLWCGAEEGGTECPAPERFECVEDTCIPRGCVDGMCPEGFVCISQTGACEVDCRLYGEADICPESRSRCDPVSGACVE